MKLTENPDPALIASVLARRMQCRSCKGEFIVKEGCEMQPDQDTLLRVKCPKCGKLLAGIEMR